MSAEAMGWVYRHSPYKGAKFSVHLAVADSVNDHFRNEFWMEQGKLGLKARMRRQAVNESLRELEADGFIRDLGAVEGLRGVRRFRFLFPRVPVVYESRWVDPDAPVRSADTSDDAPVRSADTTCPPGGHEPVRSADTDPNKEPQENPTEEIPPTPLQSEVVSEEPDEFDNFWEQYPRRHGKKLGRGDALKQWKRLKPSEIPAVIAGVRHYADACARGLMAKDAFRWLRDRCWEDWQEPAQFEERPSHRPPSTTDVVRQIALEKGLWNDRN
jgi:hypothetical protein